MSQSSDMPKFEKGKPVDLTALVGRKKPKPVHTRGAPAVRIANPKPGGWKSGSRMATFTLAMRIALAMRPGHWYGRPDLERATGAGRNNIRGRIASMLRDGLVETARDPDAPGRHYPKGEQIHSAASIARRQPEWLFRLTDVGEALRRRAALLA